MSNILLWLNDLYVLSMQFVNFTELMSRNIPDCRKEADFALAALMEIPSQYKATIDLQLLGYQIIPIFCGF